MLKPIDPHVDRDDIPRLTGQNGKILDLLIDGPRTNDELSRIARKYTSRISDIRKRGYVIKYEPLGGGLTRYTLVGVEVEDDTVSETQRELF